MNIKRFILLTLIFTVINALVYVVTEQNSKQRIKLVLDDNLKTLTTHYNVLLQTQKATATTLYQSTIELDRVLEIISQAKSTTKEKKVRLRNELQKLLSSKYARAKQNGILQYHFILPNNESFLRMHKPSKFGDDLTDIRDDFRYTNETKKPVRGFVQGRTAHGFRNTFPLFNKKGNHVGAMEVSFSSDSFQWYLNHVSNIHTHFLVDKSIFEAKAWTRDDLVLKYTQSAEHANYMITITDIHSKEKCIDENRVKLKNIREEIDAKILKGSAFSTYVKHFKHIDVISFLPIKNLKEKTVAWLVSYEKSPFVELTLKNMLVMRIVTVVFSFILIYFIALVLRSRGIMEEERKLLDDIVNATDNIMFITDFKKVGFSNYRFKNILDVKHDILDMFAKVDGYLHADLLKENENLISLIKRTPEDERVVTVIDRHFETKAFKISISKTNSEGEYLITLSDITKLKEKQVQTEKKAYIDGLTRVYNRNKFNEIFDEEMLRVKRYNHPLSMAIIDIDKFKDFNDTYGHLIGDEVLIMMAQSVNDSVRETDCFARWGGEEFIVLFKETTLQNAKIISLKLKDIIQKLNHPVAGNITASFGLTEYREGDTIESIFQRCDEALYMAKENGRNRVELL